MKVLLDARVASDHFTGIGRYAFGLAAHLPVAIPEVEFMVAWNPRVLNGRFDWSSMAPAANRMLVECEGDGLGALDSLRLDSIARRERADVIHAPYFTAALTTSLPTVVTLHDLIPFDGSAGGLRRRLVGWGLARAVRRARSVVTPSEVVRREAIERLRVDPARLVAIPPGIRVPADSPLPDWAPRVPYVLYVGVQKPHKNLETLLKAFVHAFPSEGVALVMAGPETDYTERLRDLARELNLGPRVILAGPQDEVRLGGLIRHASVLALVSLAEGFGVPPIEAMSVGVPVVVSDLPVLREVCGVAADFVGPQDLGMIGAALRRAVGREDEVRQRILHGLEVSAKYSWPTLALRYASCYRMCA